MGRVKTLLVKRTARKLLERHPEKFTDNFESNKKAVSLAIDINKKIRNSVAGYITRLVKQSNKKNK